MAPATSTGAPQPPRPLPSEEVRRRTADELKVKAKLGQAVTGASFKRLVEEFPETYRCEAASEAAHGAITPFPRAYAPPYFGNRRITELNEAEIIKFFDWRPRHALEGSDRRWSAWSGGQESGGRGPAEVASEQAADLPWKTSRTIWASGIVRLKEPRASRARRGSCEESG
jgi:hypothetical protein